MSLSTEDPKLLRWTKMFIASIIGISAVCAFMLGYKLGGNAMRNHWVEQIKREERARHLTQGNTYWQT